jgi:hypothetical protein
MTMYYSWLLLFDPKHMPLEWSSCCVSYMFSIMHSLIINPGFVINRVTRHQ